MTDPRIPIWDLRGVDAETGKNRKAVVFAETEDEAVSQAGFMVGECVMRGPEEPAPPIFSAASGPANGPTAPAYLGLQVVGAIQSVVGILILIAGVLSLIGAAGSGGGGAMFGGTLAVASFAGGLTTLAFGQAIYALRDIARNSFRA